MILKLWDLKSHYCIALQSGKFSYGFRVNEPLEVNDTLFAKIKSLKKIISDMIRAEEKARVEAEKGDDYNYNS